MTAIVLAAGIGRRLWPLTADQPKCLIPLPVPGGCTLNRLILALEMAGVDRLVCVVGYFRYRIGRAIQAMESKLSIRLVVNERYRLGSVCSLHVARRFLDDEVLILDADVLFPLCLLSRLVQHGPENAFLMDPSSLPTGEEMMLMVQGNRVRRIGRQVENGDWDLLGESLGFLKLGSSAAASLRKSVEASVEPPVDLGDYEMAYLPVLDQHDVGFVSIEGQPWTGIDSPADLMMAARSIAPRIADHELHESRSCRILKSDN